MTARRYVGRALNSSARMIAGAAIVALLMLAGVWLACALSYVLNLPR